MACRPRSRHQRKLPCLLLLCSLLSCPSLLRAAPPERLALLPFACAGTAVQNCAQLRQKLAKRLAAALRADVVSGAAVDRAVGLRCEEPAKWWSCLEQDANLFALSQSLGVPAALSVRVASLGERQTVKLRWIDAGARTITIETLEASPGDLDAWLAALRILLNRRYPPPQPAPAWFERWELWTAVGAGAALIAGVALAVTLVPGDRDPADYHLRLP